MIRIFRSGKHAHRTPLSYPALAPLFADAITEVAQPSQADLYVFGHFLDLQAAEQDLVADWRRRQRPILLLSEEPFWDTIWARQPLVRHRLVESHWGLLPVQQLNHHNSSIFQFDRIPYYLLTNHRFANAYATKFSRNARRDPTDWCKDFAARPRDLTFMFERRPEPHHAVSWPEGSIYGLCAWRTEVAEATQAPGSERLGRSWQPDSCRRQLLSDWHLDKMTLLDGRSRVVAAFENTHQPNYITEKLFDAFACGALPAYWATPEHRIHDFSLPPQAWLNLQDCSATEAAARLEGLSWTDHSWMEAFSESYCQAQKQLAELFANPRNWQQERLRLKVAVLGECHEILDGGRPEPSAIRPMPSEQAPDAAPRPGPHPQGKTG